MYACYLFQTDKSYLPFSAIFHTQGKATHTCSTTTAHLNESPSEAVALHTQGQAYDHKPMIQPYRGVT